jgi:hypothetical protein
MAMLLKYNCVPLKLALNKSSGILKIYTVCILQYLHDISEVQDNIYNSTRITNLLKRESSDVLSKLVDRSFV